MQKFFFGFLILFLSGCGKLLSKVSTQQTYSLDAVKLIAKSISQGEDPSTYGQSQYEVNSERRLLLKFEELSKYVDSVDLSSGKKLELQISVGGNAEEVLNSLKICPLLHSWMMLATWEYAHPFGEKTNKWKTPGGDYDEYDCVSGKLKPFQKKGDERTLLFDVTEWFKNFPRARKTNDGLIVISSSIVKIIGETSGSFSPRLIFDSFED